MMTLSGHGIDQSRSLVCSSTVWKWKPFTPWVVWRWF